MPADGEMPDPEVLSSHYSRSGRLDDGVIAAFREFAYSQADRNPRPMPWRETFDPYCILVSEIMLQQTQVERVRIKYEQFLDQFPTLAALSAATLSDVLRSWKGLGYNRRAIALKRCAEEICSRFCGTFPQSVHELESLPGIGPYTARAVAAFAFGLAEPLIETNIRTVFIHFFFHGREQVSDREIMALVDATLDRSQPRAWYYALMDLGVFIKKQHPNPGRRSRHHTQQSRFEGSRRQLRSRLLDAIIQQPGISGRRLSTIFADHAYPVEENLADLVREGFIVLRSRRYFLAEETKKG